MPSMIERKPGILYGFNADAKNEIPIKNMLTIPHAGHMRCMMETVLGRLALVALVRKKVIVAALAMARVSVHM
jgi:hypothetical protein